MIEEACNAEDSLRSLSSVLCATSLLSLRCGNGSASAENSVRRMRQNVGRIFGFFGERVGCKLKGTHGDSLGFRQLLPCFFWRERGEIIPRLEITLIELTSGPSEPDFRHRWVLVRTERSMRRRKGSSKMMPLVFLLIFTVRRREAPPFKAGIGSAAGSTPSKPRHLYRGGGELTYFGP